MAAALAGDMFSLFVMARDINVRRDTRNPFRRKYFPPKAFPNSKRLNFSRCTHHFECDGRRRSIGHSWIFLCSLLQANSRNERFIEFRVERRLGRAIRIKKSRGGKTKQSSCAFSALCADRDARTTALPSLGIGPGSLSP